MQDQDFSKFVGGWCQKLVNGGPAHKGQAYRGDINSIMVVGDILQITLDWVAVREWRWMGWIMDHNPQNLKLNLFTKIMHFRTRGPGGQILVDTSSISPLLTLYPKDYNGEEKRLSRASVEANQKWVEMDAKLNAGTKNNNYSYNDNV